MATLQHCNTATLQHCNTATLQHCNTATLIYLIQLSNILSHYAKNNVTLNQFQKIKSILDKNFSNQKPLENLEKFFQSNINISNINLLLLELLSNSELIEKVANRSYWHGNGFLKIVLLSHGYKLRLHIWFPNVLCEENIHSHRWGFISKVVLGTLYSEL